MKTLNQEEKQSFLKKFGEKIKELRKKQNVSQERLADLSEIERSYMGRIERGESNPPAYTVYKIKIALGLDSSETLI